MEIYVTNYFDRWDNLSDTVYVGTDKAKAFSFLPDAGDREKNEVWVQTWIDEEWKESKYRRLGDTEWRILE